MGSLKDITTMGARGITAGYSGFETCLKGLGAVSVECGHGVTMCCRSDHSE